MKRFLFFLSLCLVFCTVSVSAFASSDLPATGLNFDSYKYTKNGKSFGMDSYESAKPVDAVPHTFEAWIYADYATWNGGTILGNYWEKLSSTFSFSLNNIFHPTLTLKGADGVVHSAVFSLAEMRDYSRTWAHLVIVFDEEAEQFRCYINGEMKQALDFSDTCPKDCKDGCAGLFSLAAATKYPVYLGGDMTPLNPNYFDGYMKDVALYSTVRTDSEISESYQNGINAEDGALLLYYDLDCLDKGVDIKDESKNGCDLRYSKIWLTEEEMEAEREKLGFSGEYEYAIAVIGDPQYATDQFPEAVRAAYQWLAENKDAKNIKFVIGVGDITDQCQEKEWLEAADALKILENAGIDYSLVRGNHDCAGNVTGVSQKNKKTAKPELFDALFAAEDSHYLNRVLANGGLYEEGSVKNTYRTVDCEGDQWLILSLDWRVDEDIYRWAQGVIESHPEHRVIITTHDYMNRWGAPSSNGKNIWENLAGQYENVVFAIGGHHTWDDIEVLQAEGVHGNTVTQMLIDPQESDRLLAGVGIVTMFYFSENGSVVDIEHYSPEWDQYFKSTNQMRIDLGIGRQSNLFLILGISIAAVVLIASVGAFFFLRAKRKRTRTAE